jgi:histidine triad (HIT) family protein
MDNCVFCKIIKGEIAADKIYEDDQVIAILDHRPVRKGHAMVMPKKHVDHFIALDDELAAHICQVGNALGRKIQTVLNPKRVGFVVAGFGVPHAHFHVIPMHEEQDITSSQYASIDKGHIKFSMDHIPIANGIEQKKLIELLKI